MYLSLRRWQSVAIVLIMLTATLSLLPVDTVHGVNQSPYRISSVPAPSNVWFHGAAWNEENYAYAIAVGEDSTATDSGMIFRYDPENGWTNLTWLLGWGSGEVMYDVVYYQGDSFFILGDNGGECDAYFVENASGNMTLNLLYNVEAAGAGFTAGCFDPNFGNAGALVGVGTPYGNSGMISWYDLYNDEWNKLYVKNSVSLLDVVADKNSSTPYVIAVGRDNDENHAVAYLCDYKEVYPIAVPPDAATFKSVDWAPDGDYLIIAGEDINGYGMIWKMDNIRETMHISYYDSTVGHQSLKYAEYDGYSWHLSTVDPNTYAGYYPSIAMDYNGNPHISYWDGANTYLKHAYLNNGTWNIETVDTAGNVGQYSSIAIAPDNNPRISYYDTTNGDLKYAEYDGIGWNMQVAHGGSSDVGQYSSLAIIPDTSSYYPSVSYIDATNSTLMHAYKNYYGWHHNSVSAPGTAGGGPTSIMVAPSSGSLWHISYYDSADQDVRHAYSNDIQSSTSWYTEVASSPADMGYNSMDLNEYGYPVIAYTYNNRFSIAEQDSGGGWSTESGIDYCDGELSFKIGIYGERMLSYYYSGLGLRFAIYSQETGSWNAQTVDPNTQAGEYNSLALGVSAEFTPIKGTMGAPPLNAVDWEDNGDLAIIGGNGGKIYIYYPGHQDVSEWTSSAYTYDIGVIAVRSPGSPGFGLAIGESTSAGIISYQIYNADTEIAADNNIPHINQLDIRDSLGQSRLNKQSDVGSTYTFFMNCSYDQGWADVGGLDIYAWYDFGNDDINVRNYNDTEGKNYNFHLHFSPDTFDPVNNPGTWELKWPNGTDEVTLIDWYQKTEDRSGFFGSMPGAADGWDYFHLFVNISFGAQLVFAPGQGWAPAGNQSDPNSAFNDLGSWNLNITIFDRTTTSIRESKYDEFGIYAYTEISVHNNPGGQGFPGSLVELSPPTVIGVRSNIPYYVKVNISDMVGTRNPAHIIDRGNVEVRNSHSDVNATNSDISVWTSFTSGGTDALYVWGNGSSMYQMPNLANGTWSAGLQEGYSDVDVSTSVFWRIFIPPSTPDDHYRATVVIEITY